MDAKKFGSFLAALRKEKHMTQAELGQRLHVTDKAVSKWERGLGFPDINTIAPLAEALGVSVLEIMKSERMEDDAISDSEASELMKNVIELHRQNRKQERTATGIAIFITIFTAVLCYIAGFGSVGGCIFFGAVAAVAQTCIYFYLESTGDREGRKIYAVIGAIACVILAWLLYIVAA